MLSDKNISHQDEKVKKMYINMIYLKTSRKIKINHGQFTDCFLCFKFKC